MNGQMRAIGVEERTRFVTRLVPTLPQNFLIDPVATSIDDALGVAVDKFVPKHVVQQGILDGIYYDVDIQDAPSDSNIEFDPESEHWTSTDKVRLTTYYGKVHAYLFYETMMDEEDMEEDIE